MDHVSSEHQHDADVGIGRGTLIRAATRTVAIAVTILAALAFAALGIWQLERRAWKLDLIARVETRIHAAPAAFPWSEEAHRDVAYRRVAVRGVYDHRSRTLVQALTERGAGWWVVTPLFADQGVVLVNRGFVPNDRRAAISEPAGRVTVTGLVRLSEPGGGFLRRNDPAADRWYSRDVAAIGDAHGLHCRHPQSRRNCLAATFIDADATPQPGGWPIGGLTVVAFRNAHLVYALTWFGLAAMSAGAAILLARMRDRA